MPDPSASSSSGPSWSARLKAIRIPLAVIVVAGILFGVRSMMPVQVQTAKVEKGPIAQVAFGRGTLESQREAEVGFDLVGRLREVLVEEGTHVTLGQALARLETQQARADFKSAQTGVASARTSLKRLAVEEARARNVLAAAQREASRTQQLFVAGAVTQSAQDEASDKLRLGRADLDRVLAQRAEATRGIEAAAGGAEQRRVAIVRATLLAPFEGLVTRRLREPGDTVTIGASVLRLVDTQQVYVNAAMDETVLPFLTEDQVARITFPGTDESVPGHVGRIAWESDRQTHELLVEVIPDKVDRRIAIGQRADVRIELRRKEDATQLPSAFIHRDGEGPFVYVDRDGWIERSRVTLGITGETNVEIVEGVQSGDTVLAAPKTGTSLPQGRRWTS